MLNYANILSVTSYGVVGDGTTDDTLALQAAVDAAVGAGVPTMLNFEGLPIRTGNISLDGAESVIFNGQGAALLPLSQTTGRLIGDGLANVGIAGLTMRQTAGTNYNPSILLSNSQDVRIEDNRFEGCGYGAQVVDSENVAYRRNVLRQVGIAPRPSPLDASDSGYAAGFEIYGAGLTAVRCDRVIFENNDFENQDPASGFESAEAGGAGGFGAFLCNDVRFEGGRAINAPGQGFLATGEWQETTVVSNIQQGTIDYSLNGRTIRFAGCHAAGCNQEGLTAFGCGIVHFDGCVTENNRNASLEIWQCWSATIDGCIVFEDATAANPVSGALGGLGAVHIVGSYGVQANGPKIRKSRNNGIYIAGSYLVGVANAQVFEYGADDGALYAASGIAINRHYEDPEPLQSAEVHIDGAQFLRTPLSNNAGGDFFAQDQDVALIYVTGATAVGRPVTYVNATGAFSGTPFTFVKSEPAIAWGGQIYRAIAKVRANRVEGVGTSPMPIFDIASTTAVADSFEVHVNGSDDTNGFCSFAEKLLVCGGVISARFGICEVGSPAARTYSIVGDALELAMASGSYSVRLSVEQVLTGSTFV